MWGSHRANKGSKAEDPGSALLGEKSLELTESILAWRIPATGEPGGLPSMGLHRVRHD